MNDNEHEIIQAAARATGGGGTADAITTFGLIIMAPFLVSAYASLWSFAWRLIP